MRVPGTDALPPASHHRHPPSIPKPDTSSHAESARLLETHGQGTSLMMTDEIHSLLDRCVLCWLATSDSNGIPNVSPKEIFATMGDDRLVIANIKSPGSVANVRANPAVCVSVVDVFSQRGFKLRGAARNVHRHEADFAALAAPLEKLTSGVFPILSVIEVRVETVEEILAPSYVLFPDKEESTLVAEAMAAYGVRPA